MVEGPANVGSDSESWLLVGYKLEKNTHTPRHEMVAIVTVTTRPKFEGHQAQDRDAPASMRGIALSGSLRVVQPEVPAPCQWRLRTPRSGRAWVPSGTVVVTTNSNRDTAVRSHTLRLGQVRSGQVRSARGVLICRT